MLSLSDMLSLATSCSGVELYKKGKYRGKLFITQCELEQPVDMMCKDGKQGYVSSYPPRKQVHISASLPAYWPASSTSPPTPYQLPNPTYPNQPLNNQILGSSKIPSNNQAAYLPSHALQPSYQHVRTMSNPEGMMRRKPSSSLHDRVLRKASQGASKMGLGSVEENLEKIGLMKKNSLGSLGNLVSRATRSKTGWSLGDQLDRLAKK